MTKRLERLLKAKAIAYMKLEKAQDKYDKAIVACNTKEYKEFFKLP